MLPIPKPSVLASSSAWSALAAMTAMTLSVGAQSRHPGLPPSQPPIQQQPADSPSLDDPARGGMTQAPPADTAPEGYVLVEEEILYMLPGDYPEQHMLSASKSLQKDPKAAAREIRKAAEFLKAQESRPGAQSDSALSSSVAELEAMAGLLEAGASVLARQMADAFARAHLALAAEGSASSRRTL